MFTHTSYLHKTKNLDSAPFTPSGQYTDRTNSTAPGTRGLVA